MYNTLREIYMTALVDSPALSVVLLCDHALGLVDNIIRNFCLQLCQHFEVHAPLIHKNNHCNLLIMLHLRKMFGQCIQFKQHLHSTLLSNMTPLSLVYHHGYKTNTKAEYMFMDLPWCLVCNQFAFSIGIIYMYTAVLIDI